jgi:glycosyltransferase family protein
MNTKIIIFGTGKSSEIIVKCLTSNSIEIVAYIDNNVTKQGEFNKGIKIFSPLDIKKLEWNYIIIGSIHFEPIIAQLKSLGVHNNRVIPFFSDDLNLESLECQLFISDWKYEILKYRLDVMDREWNRKFNLLTNNIRYEIADGMKKNNYLFPTILSGEIALKKIINNKYSMSRFGDGEFEIMALKERPKFQKPDELLALRLREIIKSNLANHIVAIADNYGSLEQYTFDSAMAIREYMTEEVRKFHMNMLDLDKVYYDAYVSRPYIIYSDKSCIKQKFELFKQIWDKKDIVIIEGDKTRIGVGNDLLDNAKSIKRVIAPNENAFEVYEKLLEFTSKLDQDSLILIALGPTATVLAYDLAKKGLQAIDIGHIDIEYEWFLKGESIRTDIPNKYVNEVINGENTEVLTDLNYESQILKKILN